MAKLQSVNTVQGKETLYVDVDDEITAIIDKVGVAKGKVIALVLPKRCPVLQSVVNMKLLKRSAEKAGKNLVLVTTEAGLMPLAGATGLYVASTPSSKPAIPDSPNVSADGPEDIDEPLNVVDGNAAEGGEDEDFDTKAVGTKPVGELAAAGAAAKVTEDDIDETIDMDGDDASDTPAADTGKKAKVKKPRKDKHLAVPNFDSFRKKLALAGLVLVLLLVGLVYAMKVLPHATVTVGTDSSTIPTNLTLTLDSTANKLDTTNNTVPATSQSQQKTSTQTVQATGQQNNGQKASGTITLTNCSGNTVSVSTGTSFSSGGHTFIAQDSATIPDSNYTHSGDCKNDSKGSVDVTALKGGADYNLGSASYSFSGNPGGVSAQGSQMSGGTDDIITVVQQSDINNATSKIASSDSSSVKQQLIQNLEAKGLQAVPVTFLAGTPNVTTNAKAGDQTSSVTVTAVTTYTMLGVKKSDLQTLVNNNVEGQLDKGKQVILDDGVANAQFAENNPGTADSATVAMSVKSQAGPQLDVANLKKQLAGMKSGDVKSYIEQTPGVTDVRVKYGPFWVSTVPHNPSKVKINIQKAGS